MPHDNDPVYRSVQERSRNEVTPFALALRGTVPRIESVGILAATNPGDRRLSVSENRRRFQDLRRDLLVYGMHQVSGHFGGFVDPLIVANLTRASLISLGSKYGQARVIFGAREAEGEQTAMRFELLDPQAHKRSARGHRVAARKVFITANERAPGGTDSLGEVASEFFVIPGFDPAGGANDAAFRGARVFSYQREEIADTPEVQAVLARFLARDRLLVETLGKVSKGENIAQHVLYNRRGDQNLRLVELHKLLGNWERFPMFPYEDKW